MPHQLWSASIIAAGTIVIGQIAFGQEVDLRRMTEAAGAAEISFCSRSSPNKFGFPGHAFVAFSEYRNDGVRTFRAVGHTVVEGTKATAAALSYFRGTPIAGKQMEERYTDVKQDCLIVYLNNAAYQIALTAARPTMSTLGVDSGIAVSAESYALGRNDCISFAYKVATSLAREGLRVPAREQFDTPEIWISKLKAANK